MVLKKQMVVNALTGGPTRHWWAIQMQALSLILQNATETDGGLITVNDEAFGKAMALCRSLPAGGRYVAEEYRRMWWCIEQAKKIEGVNHE